MSQIGLQTAFPRDFLPLPVHKKQDQDAIGQLNYMSI